MKINFINGPAINSEQSTRTSRRYSWVTALLLLVALGGLSIAATANLHLHVLPDGRVVAHSHPQGSSSERHDHSSSDYTFWGAFAKVLLVDLAGPATFVEFTVPTLCSVESAGQSGPTSFCPASISPRAPPAASNL